MKLKAPEGAGDPCVAGVVVAPRDGLYDVEAAIGALLIECFGFVVADAPEMPSATRTPRRRPPAKKPPAEV